MQIKNYIEFLPTPARSAAIKKKNIKSWPGWENPDQLVLEM